MALNHTLNQKYLTDIYGIFHSTAPEYTFFSSTHRRFSRIHHIIGHITRIRKFKKIDIIPSIFYDHNGMKLEIDNKKENGKITNVWK